MNLLSEVKKGKIQKPHLVLIYGQPGTGKSTFAAGFPNPIFLGTEDGTSHLDVARFPEMKSFDHVRKAFKELLTEKHEYETLAIDSIDWLEPLLNQAVCALDGSDSIDKAQGGYGKGHMMAVKFWRDIISDLMQLREQRKMNLVLVGHSEIKAFNDPTLAQPYDRIQLKINPKSAALLTEWVDFVGFATYETFLKTNKDDKKTRALGEGVRVLHTEYRAGFVAKNRLGLPPTLPLSFEAFATAAATGSPDPVGILKSNIKELSAVITDPKTAKAFQVHLEAAGNDVSKLENILNRLKVLNTK